MLSLQDLNNLRSLAKAGDDYPAIKSLLAQTTWEIDEDATSLGFFRVFIPDPTDTTYRLIIVYGETDRPAFSLLSFHVLPDSAEQLPAFNAAFKSKADALTQYFGNPSASGERQFSFRSWPYAYQRWSLPEAEFTLMQNEFDIQEGMDITLWIERPGTPLKKTLAS